MKLDDLASPALLFRESTIESNLDLMVTLAKGADRLRPHVKTHKCPEIISRHLSRGITKFKCATIAEAEMVARSGAASVILAKQPVGPDIHRLAHLAREFKNTEVLGIVDNRATLKEIAEILNEHQQRLGLMVDVDCGMNRTGIRPGKELIELYQEIDATPSTFAAGFHVYDGHLHQPDIETRRTSCQEALAPVLNLKSKLEEKGLSVPKIVVGGSPTFAIHAANPAVDECSPGTTVLWDTGYLDHFPDLPFQPAAYVMTRVISRLSDDSVCVDLGHKAVSADKPQPRVRFDQFPDAKLEMHSEEHLVIRSPECQGLKLGDRLIGIPQHICPTVSLYDYASILSDNDEVIGQWPIEARSRRLSI
jgi:D-serine deaminase-like pyridoxal phosphate-dependent protein